MYTHVNAHTCLGGDGVNRGEPRRTDHILSQEQGEVPLWSGLGLAAGWPGFSKPPQTEWTLSEKKVGEGCRCLPNPYKKKKKKAIAHNPMGLGPVFLTSS